MAYKLEQKSDNFPGQVVAQPKPLLYPSQVMLVDPTDKKPASIEWRYDEDGKMVRVSTRTERIIPIPYLAWETVDFKHKRNYIDEPKDTAAADVEKITYIPKVMTFEMEIMKEMDIQEDRIPYQFWWYWLAIKFKFISSYCLLNHHNPEGLNCICEWPAASSWGSCIGRANRHAFSSCPTSVAWTTAT